MSDSIRLDPAVDAAKRVIKVLSTPLKDDAPLSSHPMLQQQFNDDVVAMAIVILRLAGYKVADKTGEGHPNTEKP